MTYVPIWTLLSIILRENTLTISCYSQTKSHDRQIFIHPRPLCHFYIKIDTLIISWYGQAKSHDMQVFKHLIRLSQFFNLLTIEWQFHDMNKSGLTKGKYLKLDITMSTRY